MDIPSYTILGVIGLSLSIAMWMLKRFDEKRKAIDAIDKEIDSVSNADDVTRELDKLRNK